jgi:hypothetical protein
MKQPDLAGLGYRYLGHFRDPGVLQEGHNTKAKLGTGKRFAALKTKLSRRRGKAKVSDPGALAAWIGRKKYGKRKFQKLAAGGRK